MKLTPNEITLLPVGLVLIPVKFWSTEAEKLVPVITSADDSKAKTFAAVVTPT